MTTISVGRNFGVVLNPTTYTNPVVIGIGVTISVSTEDAIGSYQGSDEFFAIENYGQIYGSNTASGTGIYLFSAGSVTNALDGSIAGCSFGVEIAGGAGTVLNHGVIDGVGYSSHLGSFGGPPSNIGNGIAFEDGGAVTNYGAIRGVLGGVGIRGAPGTVVNDGSIAGYGMAFIGAPTYYGTGIGMGNRGVVTNGVDSTISGSAFGLVVSGGAGTVVNYGYIVERAMFEFGDAVSLADGGSITNATSGSIISRIYGIEISGGTGVVVNYGKIDDNSGAGGYYGPAVRLFDGGTLTNAGTIIKTGGTAVAFGGTGSNLLVLNPSGGFDGLVIGSASASNTLELASGASSGAVVGIGTQFANFGSITFDAGFDWSISGSTSGLAGREVISGFTVGDTIDLVGVSETLGDFAAGSLPLTGTAPLHLLLPGLPDMTQFRGAPSSDGTDITVACFAAGTRILTSRGEVPVEELEPGDTVPSDTRRSVRWIGHRCFTTIPPHRAHELQPVCISAGALAPGAPHRDLRLSPDHAVLFDGNLVPVRYLINDATVWQEAVDSVTYYHVELADADGRTVHDILIAEGLPTESYLDTGNRGAFANGISKNRVPFWMDTGQTPPADPRLKRTAKARRPAARSGYPDAGGASNVAIPDKRVSLP